MGVRDRVATAKARTIANPKVIGPPGRRVGEEFCQYQANADAFLVRRCHCERESEWCYYERLFGYTAEEAIGQHIALIIPRNRLQEEDEILSRIRRGERVDHFETARVRKDGTTIELLLTISPVLDRDAWSSSGW